MRYYERLVAMVCFSSGMMNYHLSVECSCDQGRRARGFFVLCIVSLPEDQGLACL